jgi:hypothetical protein
MPGWRIVVACVLIAAAAHVSPSQASLPSASDGVIAFQRGDDAHGAIWVFDPSRNLPAGAQSRITDAGAVEADPAYSPASQTAPPAWQLAFERRTPAGDWDIWRRPATGTVVGGLTPPAFGPAVPLITGPGNQTDPVYSDTVRSGTPGDPLLAYVSDRTGRPELWLRDATGALSQLTNDDAEYGAPDFAARFRRIALGGGVTRLRISLAFTWTGGGVPGIWAFDLDIDGATGKYVAPPHDLRPVVAGPGVGHPSWLTTNPDATVDPFPDHVNAIAFTTPQDDQAYLDYVQEPYDPSTPTAIPFANAAAVRRFQLTGDPGGDDGAVWAPFGDQIAFSRATGANIDLWAASADGRVLRRLTDDPAPDLNPSWQPAQQSSAQIVGGHATPAPVTRMPHSSSPPASSSSPSGGGGSGGAGAGGGAGPAAGTGPPVVRRSPRLRLLGTRWSRSAIRVRGSARRGTSGLVRVAFSCGSSSSQRVTRRARISVAGRFQVTLTVPRRCRRAARGTVAMSYGGDATHLRQRLTRSVRRR